MKRFVAIMSFALAVSLQAAASPELAGEWGQKAARLHQQTVAMRAGAPAPDGFEDELARFSVTSARLASWIDSQEGPADLGCIFRGMAGEAEAQLVALESGGRAGALDRLIAMFSDAELVSAAAIRAVSRDDQTGADAPGTCPAHPFRRDQYFTEQP